MRNIEELNDLMVELLENVDEASGGGESLVFTKRAKEIIKEISDYAQGTELYKHSADRAAEFWKDGTAPADIWVFMLNKVINAPFALYRNAAVLIHMPALEKAIEEEES